VSQVPLIAIIDDDDSLRRALMGLVRSLGHRVDGFESADAFLAAGEPDRFGCIVTDIQMPGLSGIELKQRLVEQGCAAPVIMITARGEPALQATALNSGAYCFLKKPFPAEDLIACVERALGG
jgi:FixJ family two-component response regulator